MNHDPRRALESFDRLAEEKKREALAAPLLRARSLEWPPLDDETLARVAEESFLEHDRDEASDAGRCNGATPA